MRRIAVITVLMLFTSALSAQTFISRAALDELVSPALSVTAQGALGVKERVRDIGEIDDSGAVRVSYTLENRRGEAVAITRMKASCSCLKITSTTATIAPNAGYILTAEFNPAGRSGAFSYDIDIYTSLDDDRPTERLTLRGKIRSTDAFSHLPETMGVLRLSRRSMTIEDIRSGTTRRERIVIANSGTTTLRPTAQTTVAGLNIRFEPATLEPGMEGDIIVEYCPSILPERDIETLAIVEGVVATATDRMIRITIKR